jgi:polysaccharide deacetylase 2 family uncharacterized protein YibQ
LQGLSRVLSLLKKGFAPVSLVPIDYYDDLDRAFTPRLQKKPSWGRTGTALAAVLLSISVLLFALLLGQSGLPEGSRVVLRLEPQPALPSHSDSKPAWEGIDLAQAAGVPSQEMAEDAVVTITTDVAPEPAFVEAKPEAPKNHKTLSLAAAPITGLTAPGPFGLLPQVSANGTRPLQAYARPFDASDKRPRIYIVVGGLGFLSQTTTDAIALLPDAVTLGFAPYGQDLQSSINRARKSGHEVVLEVPMEPFGMAQNNPGPYTLLADDPEAQTLSNLHWLMSRFTGYVGVVNYSGARFTSQPEALTPVIKDLRTRGLMVLDDGSSQRSQIASTASGLNAPWAVSQRTIDSDPSTAAIDAELGALETLARQSGSVTAIGFAYPQTLERIAVWSKTLEGKGIVLAPLSAQALAPKPLTFASQ